jgi:hypothetical protein
MTINTNELPKNCENWKSIDGYRNYEVSWWGRVRNTKTARILKNSLGSHGYLGIGLCKNGKPRTHCVHALVAQEWVSNPESKRCVDHIDGNKTNNHFENLRWASNSENNRNRKKQSDSSSVYKGVSFSKPMKKWKGTIMIEGRNRHLGFFQNESEAASAYNTAAQEHYKEYAKLNMLD